ncbi:MAG: glycosyltransferase family 2 protein [Lachnospiraceae bacterium]|nr:glycosyltransferase family 2 protein [Lachnospiraceae bacterium]
MKNRVACCYLTHEHPDVISEVLGHICGEYGKKGIDIYIYDSSAGDETGKIVAEYAAKGLCGLYYIEAGSFGGRDGGNDKYLHVLRGDGLNGHYDYIWPTKDRCWFEGETLDRICEAIDEDHDIVFAVDERDRYELITKRPKDVYTDPVEFFGDYGALTTNWECLIRRTDTMLDPVDWVRYESLYGISGTNNFNQTLSTFVRLTETDKCSIRVIESGLDDKRYSEKAKPLWKSNLMEVWIDKWIPAIYSLSSVYDGHKLAVIKTQLSHISLFGSNDAIVAMRDMGAFTEDRVALLTSMWSMISRLPITNLERILAGEEDKLFEEEYEEYLRSFAEHDYEKGYYLFIRNGRMTDRFPKDRYRILALSYYMFMKEIRRSGRSLLFEGIDSVDALVERFGTLSGKTPCKRLFSIIIPCYNAAEYVDRAIGSAVDQTVGRDLFEVITVNDASTDDTLEHLRNWERKYPDTIRVMTYEKNLRQGGARNLAIREAIGEYVCFLDADDWLEPDALATYMAGMKDGSVDMITSNHSEDKEYQIFYDLTMDHDNDTVTLEKEFGPGDIADLISYNLGYVCESVYRRKMIVDNDVWFPEHLAYEDINWQRLIRFYARSAVVVTNVTLHHYNHPESTMMKKNAPHHLDRLTCYEMLLNEYRSRGILKDYYRNIMNETMSIYFVNSYYMFFTRMDEIPDVYSRMRSTLFEFFPDWVEGYDDSGVPPAFQEMIHLLKCKETVTPKEIEQYKEKVLRA